MLKSAGFIRAKEMDLTPDFLETARRWMLGRERHAAEIAGVMGEGAFRRRQEESQVQIRAIEDGLLRRALFVAR
jgi:hypothetical protein